MKTKTGIENIMCPKPFWVALSVLWLVCPSPCPAPLILQKGKGWVYEQAPPETGWRRARAKDQFAVATNALAAGDCVLARKAADRLCSTWPMSDYAGEGACLLGRLHATGQGGARDEKKARNWLAMIAVSDAMRQSKDRGRYYPVAPVFRQHAMLLYLLDRGVLDHASRRLSALRAAAEKGEADAQALLGGLCAVGEGTRKDAAAARKWLRQAADRRHPGALYLLGCLEIETGGSTGLRGEAAQYFRQAAELGLASAQFDWAGMNIPAEGDAGQVFPNVFAAARQGFAPAMMLLALDYDHALTQADVRSILAQTSGGQPSESECRIEGYKWASVAESQGIESMKEALAGFKKSMTREEIAEAKQRAKALLKELARAEAKQANRLSAWEK